MTLKGIKKVAGETAGIPAGYHLQVMVDLRTGEVWTGDLLTAGSWEEYHDPDVVRVADVPRRATMYEIRTAVAAAMAEEIDRAEEDGRDPAAYRAVQAAARVPWWEY